VTTENNNNHIVAVIGSGPAGLYAARFLASSGVQVVLLNRDIKPGGLAEYGIYHDKYKMKEGLRKQFRQILGMPEINYYGNVTVGLETGLSIEELQKMGFNAILVTVGAQGTKWLGLPGEDLTGVYHAKDIVYHYNDLPPYSTMDFHIGRRVAIIGVGNVMMDIAHWTIRDLKVDQVTAVARRGPAEVKFTKKEMQNVAANLDVEALDAEIDRVTERMLEVGQDPQAAKDFILAGREKALEPISDTIFNFQFLTSPSQMIGDDQGRLIALEVEDTKLVLKDGDTKARGLGSKRILEVDTVVFCIGDRVDENFGLPIRWNEFVKNPQPLYPIDGISYEAYDPESEKPIEGIFVAGWSREASSGLVGIARKDGESGAKAVLEFLQTKPTADINNTLEKLVNKLNNLEQPFVDYNAIQSLEDIERGEAEKRGLEYYKMKTNQEMLRALNLI